MRNSLVLVAALMIVGCGSENNSTQTLTSGYRALDAMQFDEAMTRADEQLATTPTGDGSAEALYLRGRALEQNTVANQAEARKALLQARDAYHQALQQHPSAGLQPRIHAGIANASYWLDDYATALSEWNASYNGFEDQSIKSFMLYRVGLCQQRLGQFAAADQTFAAVQQQFSGTDAAKRAHEHQGYKSFTVQLATYASANTATAEATKLSRQGMTPVRSQNPQGNTVISVGPIGSYAQALEVKNRMLATHPQAIILP